MFGNVENGKKEVGGEKFRYKSTNALVWLEGKEEVMKKEREKMHVGPTFIYSFNIRWKTIFNSFMYKITKLSIF